MVILTIIVVVVIVVIGAHMLVNQVNAEFDNINGKAD
mgnify:CR=1 FL=1